MYDIHTNNHTYFMKFVTLTPKHTISQVTIRTNLSKHTFFMLLPNYSFIASSVLKKILFT